MRNIFLFALLVLISSFGFAQDTLQEPQTFVQEMPTYPGGEKALYEFLYNSISYPEREKSMNIEGTVYVNFIIEKDGTPTNFTITRGVEGGSGLDKEAYNACKKLGKFNPGTQNGVPVRVFLTIPIKFTLEGNEEPERLSKSELKQIKKDGKYICDMVFKLVEAQKANDQNKVEKLTAEFDQKAADLQKKYPKGSAKEDQLEDIVKPCLEEAMKAAMGK